MHVRGWPDRRAASVSFPPCSETFLILEVADQKYWCRSCYTCEYNYGLKENDDNEYWTSVCSSKGLTVGPIPSSVAAAASSHVATLTSLTGTTAAGGSATVKETLTSGKTSTASVTKAVITGDYTTTILDNFLSTTPAITSAPAVVLDVGTSGASNWEASSRNWLLGAIVFVLVMAM